MATLVALVGATRALLSDFGGDREVPWALDDEACETSNGALVDYLDEARDEWAIRNPIIDDSTEALTVATVQADDNGRLDLHPRVLWLRAVRLAADGHRLPYLSAADLERQYGTWQDRTGTPSCWTYADDRTARLVPAPDVATGLLLVVDRLPLTPLSWATRDLEIADVSVVMHNALPYWAAKRALETRRNAQAGQLAMKFEADFERKVGPRPNAQQLATRRRMAAGALIARGLQIRGLA